jgi:plasmid stability protein
MAAVTIRNLSDETHRALKHRAKQNGTSTEAEIRAILDEAVRPAKRILLGSELEAIGKRFGGIEFEFDRDKNPATGPDFS